MNERFVELPLRPFRVEIGHAAVNVVCATPDEAIRLARRRLSEEMPRLWDVIHHIGDNKFRVEPR